MRLAIVTAFPPSKGSLNEYGFHFVNEFLKRKDVTEVVVVADKIDALQEETVHHPKLKIIRCWQLNSWSNLFDICRCLKREKIGHVVFNVQTVTFGDSEIPAALGLFTPAFAKLLGIRAGVLTHNLIEGIDLDGTILSNNRLRQSIVKLGARAVTWAMSQANYITTPLQSYANIISERFPRADVSMLPHGTFARSTDDVPPIAKRPLRIVTMGKFGTYKKLDTLLKAVSLLGKNGIDLELWVGGSDHPNTPGYMKALEDKWSATANIRFLGYIAETDVPAFFSGARLAVFDYHATTGSSGVLHQCASFGAVPVYPLIGDFVELECRENLIGFHYTPGDVQSMAKTIQRALSNLATMQSVSDSNLKACSAFPMSQVAHFHMMRLFRNNSSVDEREKVQSHLQVSR